MYVMGTNKIHFFYVTGYISTQTEMECEKEREWNKSVATQVNDAMQEYKTTT